jgi:threonine dehydrogenase-like Zn-dependent dehydrogenase
VHWCLVTDVVPHRLKVAKECGADYTLLVETGKSEIELSSMISQLLGTQPDATIDCGGFQDTARLGIQVSLSTSFINYFPET